VLDLNQKTTTIEKVLEAGANVGVKRLKESSNRNLGDNGSDDLQREVEYAVGHESQQVVHSSGEIKRLQIGIVVDNDVRDVDLAKLREVVATAAGIDTARGDKIAVVQNNLAVQETLAEPEGPIDAASPSATYEDVAASSRSALPGPLLFLGGLALGVAFALLMLRNRRRQRDHIAAQRLRLELQRWVRNDVAQSRQP
jgi:flagellar M-ring protein FliF